MHAEIVAIGTELTTGAKLDTNSQWLSIELASVGLPVMFHTTIADDMDAMVSTLRDAVARSNVVLITGGLGPTLDDLTRQAMAALAGVDLVLDQTSLEHIQAIFARRKRVMPERNVIQAMFPAGSEVISNPRGTAPGIWMQLLRPDGTFCVLAAMPGVPSEMKHMFLQEIRPRLPGGDLVIRRARVNCFGVGESDCEQMLGDLTARGRDPEIGITVHEATITLRIEAQGRTADECDAKIATARADIRRLLGDLVFGDEDEELEHAVTAMLRSRGMTLATAESGTGGALATRFSGVRGFEAVWRGGVVVPNNVALTQVLGVPAALLASAGPISVDAAKAMAAGCRRTFGTDFALAVTEIPQYDPSQIGTSAPSLYFALAGDGLLEVQEQLLLGDTAIIRSRAAKAAMNLLRLHLLRHP